MRLFIACCFSDEIKDALSGIAPDLKRCGVSGNFSRRDNLHLTLAFLGETSRMGDVKAAMDCVSGRPFSLVLRGLGTFRRDGGDVLWVGVKAEQELFSVQKQLAGRLVKAGFDLDPRPYKPHLTLGRELRFPAGFDLSLFSANLPPLTAGVDRLSLMRSERAGGSLVYTEICTAALSG